MPVNNGGRSRWRRPGVALVLSVVALQGSACFGVDPETGFERRLDAIETEIIDVRRDIHRNPELSGAEQRTSTLVADRLRTLGFDEVRTGVGGHGVVAVLVGGAPGRVVAFRADMDAVRSDDQDSVAFASEVPGVRHICGHDVHTAIGLALAEGLVAVRRQLAGTAVLIFQPAEETATGARAMLEAGVFDTIRPDVIFTVHAAPLSVGHMATAERDLMPGRDVVTVTVAPSRTAVSVAQDARRLIEDVGTIAPEAAFGSVAGDFVLARVGNPQLSQGGGWTVTGTLTISSDAVRTRVREDLTHAIEALADADGRVSVDYRARRIAGVTNDPAVVQRSAATARRVLGDDAVAMLTTMTPAFSEDFGAFQAEVPGVMYFLGVSSPDDGIVGMPHSPDFVADERAIGVGARVIGAMMLDYLRKDPS